MWVVDITEKKFIDYLDEQSFSNFMGRWVQDLKKGWFRNDCCMNCMHFGYIPGNPGDGSNLMYYCLVCRTVIERYDGEKCSIYKRGESW
jgi:hypothetical protein